MKFSLFAHMERISPDQDQKQLYNEFIQLCKIADAGGMHAVWTGEHHGMNFTIAPNPFLNLVDVARLTKNVRLGTGTVIAPFWHPIRLAGEAAMADIITDGRLDLGIARGAYTFEYERLMPGMDAWEAGQRMRELIPAVQNLWQGDYVHEGAFYQFPKTTSAPQPVQQDGPPIWVAARDPNSHEFAVQNNCNVQVTPLWNGDEEVRSLMSKFNDACTKFPDVARPKIMLLMHTYVAGDDADVKQAAIELNRFYCYFGAWFMNKRDINQGLIDPLSDDEITAHPFYTPENMERDLVIGTAGTVIDRLRQYQELGYDEYSFWIDSSMPFERKKASLERFIKDVMPAFQ
ncbi:LLM class flavin-dependent oxidoreductase [Ruegeria sp. 2205SS24-7]|uniref:LLM class flavin-dependent oxidoreductase n=1 Tax=Ruegeria discodermiae TaxID=3064389 RepID=UPI002741927E|nr:LLM class flavin-dependent oxidoreductase [Ruegeria sp. 2205SS24-7]MDP5220334.1 LLM class flavin-dependent oxidoreductase [Ruegeria sp. 2205SS24-7]